jgi:hypothetical protein
VYWIWEDEPCTLNLPLWPVDGSHTVGEDAYGDIPLTPPTSPLLIHTPSLDASSELPADPPAVLGRCPTCRCKAKVPKTCEQQLCIEHCKAAGGCHYRMHVPTPFVTPIPPTLSQCTKPLEDPLPPPPVKPPSVPSEAYRFETSSANFFLTIPTSILLPFRLPQHRGPVFSSSRQHFSSIFGCLQSSQCQSSTSLLLRMDISHWTSPIFATWAFMIHFQESMSILPK